MFCKFKDASNGTVRTCVPRMRRAVPCMALTCPGSVVDCSCRNETCTHYDKHRHHNSTHWYCQNVAGKQLDLRGQTIHAPARHQDDGVL